ncbi:hypothetical protein GCM10023317_23960 [Actinopolymorpha pittospori]
MQLKLPAIGVHELAKRRLIARTCAVHHVLAQHGHTPRPSFSYPSQVGTPNIAGTDRSLRVAAGVLTMDGRATSCLARDPYLDV